MWLQHRGLLQYNERENAWRKRKLPAIESNELRLDNLFLLEDEAVAIIDYESHYSRENFVKYLNYAARMVKRYAIQKRLPELKTLRIIVIYTADVETSPTEYNLGGILVLHCGNSSE